MSDFDAMMEDSIMPENWIFSDDEVENRFMNDICWVDPDHWLHTEMPWNTIHGKPWKRVMALGSGSYGAVSVGQRETDGKYFAVKSIMIEYPMTTHVKRRIETQINEVHMMRFLRSKYVPRCLGCGRSNGKNGLYGGESMDVFMEYVPRGSLRSIYDDRLSKNWMVPTGIGTFDEDHYIRHYMHDLLKALQYIHSKRVVHGDIKMANVLMSDNFLMLADWGGAKQLDKDLSNLKKFLIGTHGFRSPEVSSSFQQSYPADIFSLGCTMIEMFIGESPQSIYEQVTGLNQFFEFRQVDVPHVVIPDAMSELCKDFLNLCLCQKLEDRWTAQELLHHPFITDRDKANNHPYLMILAEGLRDQCLNPPRCRMDPELDDGQPTWRVSNHLRQLYGGSKPSLIPYGWPGGCASTSTQNQVSVPARLLSTDVNFAKPFPIRVPDFYEHKEKNKMAIHINSTSHTETESRSYVEPVSCERIDVYKPEDPKPKRQQLGMSFSSVRIVPPDDAMQHFHDTMLGSINYLAQTNTAIFEEAREEAQKKLDTDNATVSDDLFPELKRLKRSASGPSYFSLNMSGFLGLSCQGGQAVEAVDPLMLSPQRSPRKGKRKVRS